MPPSARRPPLQDILYRYKPWAETLTVVGVVGVVVVVFFFPSDTRSVAVQAALGLALMISVFIARDNLRSTRKHQHTVQLSNAATLLGSKETTVQLAGVYLLSVLRTDRDTSQELRLSAEGVLKELRESAPDPNVRGLVSEELSYVVVYPSGSKSPPQNVADHLTKLSQLNNDGVLTDAEFKRERDKLLRPRETDAEPGS